MASSDTIKVAICDDEMTQRRQLQFIIDKSRPGTEINLFSSGEEFLSSFRPGIYDLIFMDILMPGMGGIDATSKIRSIDASVPIVFATSSQDHAMEGYKNRVIRYLMKPFDPVEVGEVLQLAAQMKGAQGGVSVRIGGKDMTFSYEKICYVEQSAHTLYIHMANGATLQLTGKLDDIEAQTPDDSFMRCHQSYLVNLAHVKCMDKDLQIFQMKDGDTVHIRRESVREANRMLAEYAMKDF
ncbi:MULTISPECIES: LytR/AlgR family response regulator transcription factor [unclassified Butyrivibrio]|uniref:LytR/AlgR family response regulator transcription factor n=1 Tax=unclassified Butyrivibrio TaxID=2639466 RepID=UPI00047DD5B5|nr:MULTISPECIES: LytTR family DNA-binding domain-containing protein [unclassified Butyrivibrio]MCR5341803.1 LytTR family DNA-binding domain-containing protein [Butyrivibrio sp.]